MKYRIIIEGVTGSSYTGDIAIDDIMFKDGYCVGLCSSVQPQQRANCGFPGITKVEMCFLLFKSLQH